MRLKSYLAPLAAALALLPAGAIAADYDPPIMIEQAEEYVPVEIGSGWYLRGDVGYNFSTSARGDFTYRTYSVFPGMYNENLFITGRLRNDFSLGVGFGYRFTDWLRADATVDYFRPRFFGTTVGAAPCIDPTVDATFGGTTCRSEDNSRAKALSVMANGYVDLGTYVGFTPYVGAGAGFTYLQWDGLSSTNYCVGERCPRNIANTATHASVKDWAFTYAAMAGVAYDVNKNIKIDLGYRYRRISGGPMFGWDGFSSAAGAMGTQGRQPGFSTHEFKIGLRYELW